MGGNAGDALLAEDCGAVAPGDDPVRCGGVFPGAFQDRGDVIQGQATVNVGPGAGLRQRDGASGVAGREAFDADDADAFGRGLGWLRHRLSSGRPALPRGLERPARPARGAERSSHGAQCAGVQSHNVGFSLFHFSAPDRKKGQRMSLLFA